MPQMNKGGKFIFGISILRDNLSIQFPTQAIEEYDITSEGKVFLISGSKTTGGFVVTRKGMLYDSKIGNILKDTAQLCNYELPQGKFVKYKGRLYCWLSISTNGKIQFTSDMMNTLEINIGHKLLSIRSSNIAFTMGAKGPLLEKAENFDGEIEIY
ncbi:hypothetical protein KQI42_16355 [Tissierella sp. MSJ-40]|uniref:Altered inheritance of mitochondria protein 24, mitochondrial n=1 Tax=Tissierella simiarum TaxID=2841534 RepID=A0ABS6E9I5_9FIRM|nr:hypothetical protein [Tissierella simiarum]MBU5439588.1 hypothetical protein [Tissierella simiarum]